LGHSTKENDRGMYAEFDVHEPAVPSQLLVLKALSAP